MLLVGLTGGIGSGKSTVARMLAERGAVVFDADALARRVVEPGTSGLEAVARRFGHEVLSADGSLDRAKLATLVFDDDPARRDLEAIVHPAVAQLLQGELEPHRGTDAIVVYGSPLLVEAGLFRGCDVVVVVSAPVDLQLERTVESRGFSEEQVRARMAAQATPEQRAAVADVILDNEGTVEELERQVDRLWADLRERAAGA